MAALDVVKQELRNFIVDNFLFAQADCLGENDSFSGSGLIDSTGVLELVSFLEQQYGITVEDEELVPDNLDSLAALASFLSRKLNIASSAAVNN